MLYRTISNTFSEFFWSISYSFEHLFCPFHTYISSLFSAYSLYILFTFDDANFKPDTVIPNLEPWHLSFIGFLICPHSLIWDNIWSMKLSNLNHMLDRSHQKLTPFRLTVDILQKIIKRLKQGKGKQVICLLKPIKSF